MRDHAYLWEVLCTLSNRAEAAEERRVEDERRHRARGTGETKSAIDIALAGVESTAAGLTTEERRAAYREGMAEVRAILGRRQAPGEERHDES